MYAPDFMASHPVVDKIFHSKPWMKPVQTLILCIEYFSLHKGAAGQTVMDTLFVNYIIFGMSRSLWVSSHGMIWYFCDSPVILVRFHWKPRISTVMLMKSCSGYVPVWVYMPLFNAVAKQVFPAWLLQHGTHRHSFYYPRRMCSHYVCSVWTSLCIWFSTELSSKEKKTTTKWIILSCD